MKSQSFSWLLSNISEQTVSASPLLQNFYQNSPSHPKKTKNLVNHRRIKHSSSTHQFLDFSSSAAHNYFFGKNLNQRKNFYHLAIDVISRAGFLKLKLKLKVYGTRPRDLRQNKSTSDSKTTQENRRNWLKERGIDFDRERSLSLLWVGEVSWKGN